jgi:hypothetical protein
MMSLPASWAFPGRPLAVATVLAMMLGCGGINLPEGAKKVFVVRGELKYQGKPMDGAVVTFYCDPPATGTSSLSPTATADETGKYALTTYLKDDGAPEGHYRVTIYWPMKTTGNAAKNDIDAPLPPDRLQYVYAQSQTTPLKAKVEAKENTIGFQLP